MSTFDFQEANKETNHAGPVAHRNTLRKETEDPRMCWPLCEVQRSNRRKYGL